MSTDSEYRLPYTESGYVTIPVRIREKYLTPEADEAVCQPAGDELKILIKSEREDLLLTIELERWLTGAPYRRSFEDGRIHLDRWRNFFRIEDYENEGPHIVAHVDQLDE